MEKQLTIAEYFPKGGVGLDDITCGEFEETELSQTLDEIDTNTLLDLCDELIKERGALPYAEYLTEAKIMGDAMERFTKKYREDVPKWWYPVVQRLRGKEKEKRNAVTPIRKME